MTRIWSGSASVAYFILCLAAAPAAEPEKVSGANYPLAQKFSREFVYRNVQETNVFPQWIGKTDQFWYTARTPGGTAYWLVDPAKKTKAPLFDAANVAAALSELAKKPLDVETLALSRVSVTDDGKKMKFAFDEYQYEYDLAAGKLTKGAKVVRTGFQASPETLARMTEEQRKQFEEIRDRGQRQDDQQNQQQQDQQQQQQGNQTTPPAAAASYKAISPDKKKYVYAFKHNLYLADEGAEDKAVQLSKDGEDEYTFGPGRGTFGRGRQVGSEAQAQTQGEAKPPTAEERKSRPSVTWSPDSKAFFVTRSDSRGVQELYLVDSLATPRPKLEQYKYPMPGEEKVRKQELFYCDVSKKALTAVKPKWKDERFSGVVWGKAANELRFIRRDRLQRNLAICTIDVLTGAEKSLFAESFDSAFLDSQPVRFVEETDELIWWSERSGWGHFYLYGRDGTLKNAITAGQWRTSRIVDVDGKNKQLYFVGNAREHGENIYYNHLYRVRFDGTGLTQLDPSVIPVNLNSTDIGPKVSPVKGGLNHQSYLSPSKKFVVSTASATDHAPISMVYDELGHPVMTLEQTDLSQLKATGWRTPETFVVKAADGVTDLYGNLWKPFDFDPKKSYPIIANVYPGPQTEGVTHKFAAHSQPMQMAQLGFIVIQVGHRGGSPERSKAYHSFGYYNLRDYGLVDKKAAIEQLAARHAYIDLNRVGIYGHSGGGFMSAAAVLQPPYNDFFKVAVASAGNHDNNIYNDNWSERYHGMKEVAVIEEKKDAATGSTGQGGATRTGTGQGQGGRRRPPAEEEEIEAEIEAVLTGFDPEDKQSVEEVEKKLAELQKKLAEVKQQAAEAAKVEAKKAEEKKAAEAKQDAKKTIEDAKQDAKKAIEETKKATEETKKATEGKQDMKKVEEKKTTEEAKKAEVKKDEEKKGDEKKAEEKAPPKMKFEIKVPTNAELAANLKGHLLLVHGEIDNNVHPANTMRLTDALIKANKRFELLIIPGARHGFGPAQPYFTQRMWDFFSEHLLADRQTKADIYEKDVKRR
ncbi:S9 family peptidase [Limnoglobus roseus]|uniref:Peptidase S9 n=1 Tax=Limnoglobus roseus TaxID=2598579 RepID=A0A5C1AA55_9BACT|nr:DPP IV N-terminal domain-containing protein [Limnoglobus roseus]QEL13928.1 peptidase S9 [Limnoglobus roseus]